MNNNVVVVQPRDGGSEEIWIGRGIGFIHRPGTVLAPSDPRVEQRYALVSEEKRSRFQQLFSVVAPEVIGVAEEIIAHAERALHRRLHEHIHVALPDHIGFALERLRGGLEIENPFVDEVRLLYPEAWRVAEEGAALVAERFGVPIPESEVGFLALHLHAASHAGGLSESVRVAHGVKAAVERLEMLLGRRLDAGGIDYQRLVTHLRFAIQRALKAESVHNPLREVIRESLPEGYRLAGQVAAAVAERLQVGLPEDEVAYLALHIGRICIVRDGLARAEGEPPGG